MEHLNEKMMDTKLSLTEMNCNNLRADCENCFGFCCVALYFSASDGFPVNKEAGKPCPNLQSNFYCKVHKNLKELGLKGCTSYDCLGAGQKVAQVTYGGNDWIKTPEFAKQMYDVFLIMHQIHEMLWYLTESLNLQLECNLKNELIAMINETERLTFLSPESIDELDLTAHGANVNALILKISELVRSKVYSEKATASKYKKTFGRGLDFIGADLRKKDLRGETLRGAYIIAADLRGVNLYLTDFMGADMRDANISGADLSHSIFLTQAQINTTKGDNSTKLPNSLSRPIHWSK